MSDVISKLRRLGFGGNDNQQSQQANQAQSVSSQADVPVAPQSPSQSFVPRLDRLVSGNPRLRAMVEEVRSFSIIERAILARVLFENDEVVSKIKPEDWVALIRERIGEENEGR
jgi:hypothetical protein